MPPINEIRNQMSLDLNHLARWVTHLEQASYELEVAKTVLAQKIASFIENIEDEQISVHLNGEVAYFRIDLGDRRYSVERFLSKVEEEGRKLKIREIPKIN